MHMNTIKEEKDTRTKIDNGKFAAGIIQQIEVSELLSGSKVMPMLRNKW